jgi:F0F1-type ATP synthase assembly protein I
MVCIATFKMDPTKNNKNSSLLQYAGLASQFLVSMGIGVFIGLKLDQWLSFSFPVFVWILPLLIMLGIIAKLLKDTSTRK